MGIHTTIERLKGHRVKEFYIGKSMWLINEWFYQHLKDRPRKDLDSFIDYSEIYEEPITIEDIKKLLADIHAVLEDHSLAKKVLPFPKGIGLMRPKNSVSWGKVIVRYTKTEFETIPEDELYDDDYFNKLEVVGKSLLEIVDMDIKNTSKKPYIYTLDIG